MIRTPALILPILLMGCGTPPSYRYADRVLIPPGVNSANISNRTVTLAFHATCGSSDDALTLQPGGRSVHVTIRPVVLRTKPAGWLARWSESLAQMGCISAEDASRLAAQVAEATPLEPRSAYSLLHPPEIAYTDLEPGTRISAVGPLMREGTAPGTRAIESATIDGLAVTVKAAPDLVGVETAWYAVEANQGRPGAHIIFLSADDREGDKVSHPNRPRLDYLHLPPDTAYYRLFTITRRFGSDHDMLLIGAATRDQLDRATKSIEADPSSCAALGSMCLPVPQDSVLARVPMVMANGKPEPVSSNGTVRTLVTAFGVAQPASILPTLHIKRPYLGRLTPIAFDRTQESILDLPLSGGEVLRW